MTSNSTSITRALVVATLAIGWVWLNRIDTQAWQPGGWTFVSMSCADGQQWKYENHTHGCTVGASTSWTSCFALCEEGIKAGGPNGCGENQSQTLSTAFCTCEFLCCEAGGCQEGNTGWSTGACGEGGGQDGCGCCPGSTPLILSLDPDRVQLSSAAGGVEFTFFPGAPPRRYAWPTEPADVWLAHDRNGNGQIDDASELFGTATPVSGGGRAPHGFAALEEFDSDSNGRIDRNDERFAALKVWSDRRRNGRVDPSANELMSLQAAGIESLETRYRESRRVDRWGNAFALKSRATASRPPRNRALWDVFLTSEPLATTSR